MPRQGTLGRVPNSGLPVNASGDEEVAVVGNEEKDADRAIVAHLVPRAAAIDLSARIVTRSVKCST